MNPKILIISVGFIALSGAGVFVYQDLTGPKSVEEKTPIIIEGEKPAVGEEAPQGTLLTKDDFTVVLPAGWQEVKDFQGVLTMAIDTKEEIKDEEAKNINFQTNFSVKNDDLAKYGNLSGPADYVNSIKNSLAQLIPGIICVDGGQRAIGSRNAFFVECASTQEQIDFKTLLVFLEGENKAIWAISFNTFQDSWPDYKDLFYQIAESFRLRYQVQL